MKRLAILAIFVFAAPALACPNCKDAVATPVDTQQSSAAPGFNQAIAVMLGASLLGVAGVAGLFFLNRPRTQS